MRKLAAAVASVALLVLGSGCGDSTTSADTTAGSAAAPTPGTTPAAPARSETAKPLPPCRQVWRAGKRLSLSYAGCLRDGDKVPPHTRSCSSGQQLDTYGRHHYAARGAPVQWVHDLRTSKRFRQAERACSA
jgi:hypothetical protein